MKTLQKIVIIYLLINSPLWCQKKLANTKPILFVPQGFVITPLSGYGYSNCIENTVANLNGINPAFISSIDQFSVGFSYHLESKLKESWIADIHHYRLSNYIPQSIGTILPMKHFNVGVGFQQHFSSKLDYGKISGTVVDTTSDTGYRETGSFRPISKTLLTKNSLSFSNSIKHNKNLLHIGIQINHYLLAYQQELINLNGLSDIYAGYLNEKFTFSKFGFTVGIIYKMSNSKWGLFYDKGFKLREPITNDIYEYEVVGEVPSSLSIGFQHSSNDKLKINFSGNFVFRHDVNYLSNSTLNQFDFSANFIIRFNQFTQVSCGIYDINYGKETIGNIYSNFDATYFTLGFILSINRLQFDFCIADSHWLSGEWRKQTIIKLGLGTFI
ncbi:MAG: hypothetical protein SCK70_09150 [bacterium]|nr:hypothetical protein [bacterium]